MKITYPTVLTGEYLNKNPLWVGNNYNADNQSPHSQTNRVTYTVPANRRAIIHGVYLHATRITAATTLGLVFCRFNVTISATTKTLSIARLMDNTVGASILVAWGFELFLPTASDLDLYTADLSTAGQVSYTVSFLGTEFDA